MDTFGAKMLYYELAKVFDCVYSEKMSGLAGMHC